jgi:hypothetical protein
LILPPPPPTCCISVSYKVFSNPGTFKYNGAAAIVYNPIVCKYNAAVFACNPVVVEYNAAAFKYKEV